MATIANLVVNLATNTADLFAPVDRASAKLQRNMKKMSQSLTTAGMGMTAGLTMPIVGASAAAIKFGMDINKSMANVATLIPDSGERVDELKNSVQELAIATGIGTSDMADGLYNVISALGDTADTEKILEINARAATAGLATVTDALNLTSAVTKKYGDTSAEAVSKASDLAFTTVKLGQTTFPELAASMGRVAPMAAKLNLSQEELFGTFATLTGVVGDTSMVSTGFTQVLTGLMKPTTGMTKAVAELGFAGSESMVETLGFKESLQALIGTTDGSTEAVGKLFGSSDALKSIFALTGAQSEVYDEKLQALMESTGATDEAFKEQTEGINSAGFALSQMKIELEVFAQELGEVLLPYVEAAIAKFREWIPKVLALVDWFKQLSPGMQTAILAIAALAAAIGPVLLALGAMASGVSALIGLGPLLVGVIKGIGLAMKGMLGPVGLVATAVVLLINHFELWDEIGVILKRVGEWLWSWKDTVVNVFKAIVNPIESTVRIFQWMSDKVVGNSILPEFVDAVAAEFDRMGVAMIDRTDAAAEAIQDRFIALAEEVELLENNMAALTPRILTMQMVFDALPPSIESMNASFLQTSNRLVLVREGAFTVQKSVFELAMVAVPALESVAESADVVSTSFSRASHITEESTKSLAESFGGFFKGLLTNTSKTMGGLQDTVTGMLSKVFGGGTGAVTGGGLMGSIVSMGMSTVFGPATGIVSKLMTLGMNKMKDIAWSGLKKIGGFFKSMFTGASAQELGGREVAKNFRGNMADMMDDVQRVEAGNHEWKQSVIVVRDAYIAAGKTEQEALAVMDQLWKAEKEGAGAVEEVIRRIEAVMRTELTPSIKESGDEFGIMARGAVNEIQAISRETDQLKILMREPVVMPVIQQYSQTGSIDPRGPGRGSGLSFWGTGLGNEGETYQEFKDRFLDDNPGDEHRLEEAWDQNQSRIDRSNFAHGTQGRFIDFGAGTPAMLHGRERIMTEAEGRSEGKIGGSRSNVHDDELHQEIVALRRDLPRAIGLAVQDALVLAR